MWSKTFRQNLQKGATLLHTSYMTEIGFCSIVRLRLRVFGAHHPSELVLPKQCPFRRPTFWYFVCCATCLGSRDNSKYHTHIHTYILTWYSYLVGVLVFASKKGWMELPGEDRLGTPKHMRCASPNWRRYKYAQAKYK